MRDCRKFLYRWKVGESGRRPRLAGHQSGDRRAIATISLGNSADVDKAVGAAKKAFRFLLRRPQWPSAWRCCSESHRDLQGEILKRWP